jgi:hypothetical protein
VNDAPLLDPAAFSGRVPLFPLPQVVLFPHALLPLHIFEPRYRAMTEAALAGERLIAMALLKPGWEPAYHGNPPIHDAVGVGRIVEDVRLPDGRFNLLLRGVARARVVEVVSDLPYRTARVELLEDRPPPGAAYELRRRELQAFYGHVLKQVSEGAAPAAEIPLGVLCDLLVSMITFEPEVKQAFLEEPDVGARCDRLTGLLRQMQLPGFGGPQPPKKPFLPGEPSPN